MHVPRSLPVAAALALSLGAASPDLDGRVARGREIFLHSWTRGDPAAKGGDGLGPSYNATSCVACHAQGGAGGAGGVDVNVTIVNGRVRHKHGALSDPTPAVASSALAGTVDRAVAGAVRIGAPTVTGALDAAIVRRVALSHAGEAQYCYEKALLKAPALRGVINVRLEIDGAGHVTASARTTTLSGPDVAACLVPKTRAWRFPAGAEGAPGAATVAVVPFTFTAAAPSSSSLLNALGQRGGLGGFAGLGIGTGLGLSGGSGAADVVVQRNTPALWGAGLIDDLDDDVIEAGASLSIAGHPEITGKIGRTREGRVGRFGWKGDVPDLVTFVSRACSVEVGLEVPGSPQPGRHAPGYDLDLDDLESLIAFVRTLPKPVERRDAVASDGAELFDSIGCTACHTPALGDVDGIYSDLLLHDMGEDLDDNLSTGYYGAPPIAGSREWRTAPLWGARDSGSWLHDGRAKTLEAAINKHGGEASKVRRSFWALHDDERGALVAFLESLQAP